MCPRTHRDSTSTQSVSISDVEVLTDTSESLTSDDKEEEQDEDRTHKRLSPVPNKRGGNNKLAKAGSKKDVGGGGKGEEGRVKKRQRRKKGGVPAAKSTGNLGQTAATQKKSRMRNASSEAVRLGTGNTSPHNDPNYPYHDYTYGVGGGEILGPQPAGVYFGVGGSDSSDSSDDEDDLEYTPAEMAQLLSLNELDMQPGSSDSEEEEEEGEEVRENKRRNRRGKGNNSSPDPNSQIVSSVLSPSPRQAQSRHAAHARQPEPVGLFWDIENCSVPTNKSAFTVATKMRRVFFEGKREAEFMVVCDITKERKDVINALNKAQVKSTEKFSKIFLEQETFGFV